MRIASIFLALTILLTAFGFGDLERGNRLYREGRYAEAVEAYRAALGDGDASPILHYNLGTALLRLEEYDEAERHLRAALASIEPDARERTHYNLGNRFLQAARATADPEASALLLEAAVEAYKQALRLDPGDADAKWNLELALREQDGQAPSPQSGGGQQDQQEQEPQESGDQDRQDGDQGNDEGGPQPGPASRSPSQERQDQGQMDRDQAERILSAIEQNERELHRQKLRKGRRDTPVARDW